MTTVVLALLATTTLAGCVSMATAGPVQSYPVTQGPGGQSQPYMRIVPQPPGDSWNPQEIVSGFLTASAAFGDKAQVARQYLTPQANREWKPSWSALVFSTAPAVHAPQPVPGHKDQVQVLISGTVRASLSGTGGYAVPQAQSLGGPPSFTLVKYAGQWRIADAPSQLLLASDVFQSDYQLRNLYFFDPADRYLVPDPVYVPLQDTPTDLMNGLVHDLIAPPADWLSQATRTAIPPGTKSLDDVTVEGGTATVNLGGAALAKATPQALQQISAQLLWTLSGAQQAGSAVQSVELLINGHQWIPPNAQDNPVQSHSRYSPPGRPAGAPGFPGDTIYYLNSAGDLVSRVGVEGKPDRIADIGRNYDQIAVSPDAQYVAGLRDGVLYIGPFGGRLSKRSGGGYTALSWDSNDNLWAATSTAVFMLHGDASPGQPAAQPIQVQVQNSSGGPNAGPFNAIKVAPDGVRVALITGVDTLNFGAIVMTAGARPGQESVKLVLSPFSVSNFTTTFTAVTWYGPDNVITLGQPGPSLTEYPVNGGTTTSIPADPEMVSISAIANGSLIAARLDNTMSSDATLSGAWTGIGKGFWPTYAG